MKRRIAFIVNGSRRIKTPIQNLLDRILSSDEFEAECSTTLYPKHAIELASPKADEAYEIIVAVGGDGTCNEVVNGIMKSTQARAVFAVLPNGTGNDFQKMLGRFDPERFYQALLQMQTRRIDLCMVNQGLNSNYSLNIAGIGFDGSVIQLLSRQRTTWKMTGKFSYATAIVRAFFTYRKPKVLIKSADFHFEGRMLMLAACNGTTFGHGLIIAPDACIDDGRLSLTLFANVSLPDYVRNLAKLKKGVRINHPEVHYFTSKEVSVHSIEGALCCENDGELNGEGSFVFTILPSALSLLDPGIKNQ